MGITCKMTSYVSSLEWPKNQNTKQKRTKTHQWATSGDRSNKSSMRKPGIPPARIPEITRSSRTGMIFTQALRSKHRRRRVATRVVRNERTEKKEKRKNKRKRKKGKKKKTEKKKKKRKKERTLLLFLLKAASWPHLV